MSRSLKVPREFVSLEASDVVSVNSPGFLDVVAKFGPLVIAIIAVAFCFYIYKKVVEMDKTPNTILQNFISDQTQTNYHIQESYNAMVEQFNNLSGAVHSSLVKDGTIESQISPSPSIVNETIITQNEESIREQEHLDDASDLSVSNTQPKRRGKKLKGEINL